MNQFLKSILDGIFALVNSYGLSIVLFTILVRLCLMPLDFKSRVGMRKMAKLAPKQAELQKKYAKDQDKLNRKLNELYRKENCSPLSGCWPMLVSMPILIAMFNAMRYMANEQLVQQAFDILLNGEPQLENFLWMKNLWMPDSPFAASWPSVSSLRMIETNQWLAIFGKLEPAQVEALAAAISLPELTVASFAKGEALNATIAAISSALQANPDYIAQSAEIPYLTLNFLSLLKFAVVKGWNGLFLLPLLSAGSQLLMTKVTQSSTPQQTGPDGKPQGGGFMKWFFPIFSLVLCATYTAAFALYWVVSNVIAMAQTMFINWYLDRKERMEAENPTPDQTDLRGNGALR